MEEIPSLSGASETESSDVSWWNPDFMQKLKSVALVPQEEQLHTSNSTYVEEYEVTSHAASQILWETGVYPGQIPNGFYAVIPDKKLKKLFGNIPSSDDTQSLGLVGHRVEMILVDSERDKKLSMLKQLSAALVKGQSSNPASVIKKIAGLVSDVYKRPSSELSPAKASMDETSLLSDNKGPQLLGQIRHGSCWPRALLFKVLADAAGLESKLMVGLPSDENFEWVDSYKHLSVVVVLNATELFVDLMRFPGQLIPFSTKAFFLSHISTAGESDSAENDSCDSPLEPNSPLCGFTDRPDALGHEQDENPYSPSQQRTEASLNIAGPSLRNVTLRSSAIAEGKLSSSHSESNIANALWRRSRRKVISEQRTASSSPEHPLLRARARSMLGGDRHPLGDYVGMEVSRSDGARPSEARRPRRRSISITPEIGDDIVRAVKAMNETLKQNRLLSQSNEILGPQSAAEKKKHEQNVSREDLNVHDQMSSSMLDHSRNQISSEQKSSSLPSSPHDLRCESSNRSGDNLLRTEDCASTWNNVLQSSEFLNQPLLLYEEWYIDFSELTVGTRVGIGSFGEVFRGIWNGTDVAIKIFLEQDLTAENMEDFCNEISILSRLRHPNVILFLGACTKPPHLSMVTEFMEMGSLYYLIHISGQKRRLSWRRRLKMLRDICRGLMCIHRMKIVHRDIKSANCLVNKHWAVKICDFGLSRVMTDVPMKDNSSAGTPEWMAPELIRQEPFTEKCDIFSLGVIMWELCTLNRPWQGTPPVQVIYAIANEGAKLEIPEGPLGKLIADCWAEPNERPSCEEILSRLLDCEYTLC